MMKTHNQMVTEWMQNPDFKQEYEALETEFSLFDEFLQARKEAGLTQAEVAQRMGTKTIVTPNVKTTKRLK